MTGTSPEEARVGSVEELLASIARQMNAAAGGQIVHVEPLPPREAAHATPTPPLPPLLQAALGNLGITQLYTHQVEALERVRRGENIVVVTATSSGKTLCYNLPIIERLLEDRTGRALYLYPINALVNDQLKSLFKINLALGNEALGIARYTGSLSNDKRKAARARNPHIWLTNPEMLHLSFLLWHQNWEDLWRNLRFVVIDEVHTYRGVFGSNMAHLLRRVQRVAEHYGSSPQFICCSATIANPKELAEKLVGREFAVVDRDGAGSSKKLFVLWNPPLVSQDDASVRRSYAEESVELLLHCVRAHYNTIVFARARKLTERMLRLSRSLSEERGEEALPDLISSYRAGYLAEEREEIEGKLKSGEIQGIITTNALEMGIDIGGLDAAIISGYPGTIMSTWQQAGRAGRRGREALVVLVASQNPLDQYYVHHPCEFFASPHELAVVDLENPYIRLKHLLCSVRELPLSTAELERMSPEMRGLVEELVKLELLVPDVTEDAKGWLTYPASRKDMHLRVSLRAASQETYRIVDETHNEIGSIEPPNVFREAHPGAIYQHGGDDYRVTYLDRAQKVVRVREEHAPHYTRSSSTLNLRVESIYQARPLDLGGLPVDLALGDVLIEETVRGYQELRLGSDEMVKRVNLDYPLVIKLHTTAMWLQLPAAVEPLIVAALPKEEELEGESKEEGKDASPLEKGLHAVEHLLTGVMPLLVMCDQRDIGGFFHRKHPDLREAAVFIYDAYEGGIGLAEIAYQRAPELLKLAYDTVARCQCKAGCPSCIQSGVCRLRNEILSKSAAQALLAALSSPSQGAMAAPVVSAVERPSPLELRAQVLPTLAPRGELSRQRALQELLDHTRRQGIYDRLETSEPKPLESKFAKGDWVEHSPFGRGLVIASRIEGQRELVQVRFMRGGEREIDASKGSLRKAK